MLSVDLDYVAQVLEPVLGPQEPKLPDMAEFSRNHAAVGGRSAGDSANCSIAARSNRDASSRRRRGDRYFEPAAMVAFARFSFMIRRTFFRLMHDDLNAIQDGLRELERRGVTTIDCRRAQFSAEEPIARLRMICQSWKVMFHAEYSSGQPLRMLVDLRAAVDDAMHSRTERARIRSRRVPPLRLRNPAALPKSNFPNSWRFAETQGRDLF